LASRTLVPELERQRRCPDDELGSRIGYRDLTLFDPPGDAKCGHVAVEGASSITRPGLA